jgi:hypothetical protein
MEIIKDPNAITIKIDLDKDPIDIQDAGLIDKMEIINLDCDEAVFGEIKKIIRYENRIYLMDDRQTHSIFIYDTLGHYINKLEKRGQGPGEYAQLTDIFINSHDRTLNIVGRADRKILKYDLDGKRFLEVKRLPKAFTEFTMNGDEYFGYMANWAENPKKRYNLWTLFSDNIRLKNYFFEIDKTWNSISFGDGTVFSQYGNKTYYITNMDFNIYSINNDTAFIAYTFDLGSHAWPKAYREREQYEKLIQDNKYVNRFYRFQETNNHLITEFIYYGVTLVCVYDKRTKEVQVTITQMNNQEYFMPFGHIIGFDEKSIYTLVEAEHMKFYWEGKNMPEHGEQIKRLREKIGPVREDGNPYLLIYTIN